MSNNAFDIIIVGDKFSGKTKFLNALIGEDLLKVPEGPNPLYGIRCEMICIKNSHSRAERPKFLYDIYQQDMAVNKNITSVIAYDSNHKIIRKSSNIGYEELYQWRCDEQVSQIEISSNFKIINQNIDLNFYDFNSSRNSKNIVEVINNNNHGIVFYVLSAFEYNEEEGEKNPLDNNNIELLREIQSIIKQNHNKDIVFILNKSDFDFDSNREIKVLDSLKLTKDYIEKMGFKNNKVIPVSALQARYFLRLLSDYSDKYGDILVRDIAAEGLDLPYMIGMRFRCENKNILEETKLPLTSEFDEKEKLELSQYLEKREKYLLEYYQGQEYKPFDENVSSKSEAIKGFLNVGMGTVLFLIEKRIEEIGELESIDKNSNRKTHSNEKFELALEEVSSLIKSDRQLENSGIYSALNMLRKNTTNKNDNAKNNLIRLFNLLEVMNFYFTKEEKNNNDIGFNENLDKELEFLLNTNIKEWKGVTIIFEKMECFFNEYYLKFSNRGGINNRDNLVEPYMSIEEDLFMLTIIKIIEELSNKELIDMRNPHSLNILTSIYYYFIAFNNMGRSDYDINTEKDMLRNIANVVNCFLTLICLSPTYSSSYDKRDIYDKSIWYDNFLSFYLNLLKRHNLIGKPKEVGYFLWRQEYNITDKLVLKIISNLFNKVDFNNIPYAYRIENEIKNLFKEDIDEEDEEEIWFGQNF